MSSRLGRNPFEKKPGRAIDIVKQMEPVELAQEPSAGKEEELLETPANMREKIARFVLIDIPAESYLLALKAYLVSLSFLEVRARD